MNGKDESAAVCATASADATRRRRPKEITGFDRNDEGIVGTRTAYYVVAGVAAACVAVYFVGVFLVCDHRRRARNKRRRAEHLLNCSSSTVSANNEIQVYAR